ncbi:MAG: GNAT family N-acetyltransferase [Oscillospiraceae bacterium]|nr:GNAT family N-acetyltransferase [Oscillospiraceae bacterium]MCL2279069.1 GNAT family N-acetyltransferase [Oscillospiraceae bacterium]
MIGIEMKFNRYKDLSVFRDIVLDILLEDEAGNNLPISIITDSKSETSGKWLMSTVTDNFDNIILIGLCALPHNVILSEPTWVRGSLKSCLASVEFLACEMKRVRCSASGVFARVDLADRFADAYFGNTDDKVKTTSVAMRLDKLLPYERVNGNFRQLAESDLSYAPAWERAFCIDCNIPSYTPEESSVRITARLGTNRHYIWEDGEPVSQVVYGRDTPGGAVINWVYTPPEFRGNGYASALVAEVSELLLKRGKSFCCLFADADNPISRSVYSKLGYKEVCFFRQIQFEQDKLK